MMEVEEIVLEGFLPRVERHEIPQRSSRVALQELGLPYTQDPAITRQLAAFLRAHTDARPDAILLNGGVFNAARIAERLVNVVSGWWPEAPPIRVLEHGSLELAVARGAAYYALVRRGMGRKIGGGAAHSFYVGLDKGRALLVIPRGQEEGATVELGGRTFHLMLGRPVQFPLFTSTSDRVIASGEIVPVTDDLHPLPPIHTLLKSSENKTGQIPVHLRATLTPIGTLELWCVSDVTQEQWRLEFGLRGATSSDVETTIESMPPAFSEARISIEKIYGGKSAHGPAVTANPKELWRALERILGPREQWRLPVLRELWGALFAGVNRRRRSADHERIFFQLAGYSLRPGYGYPLDNWRCEQTAELFSKGIQHHSEKPVWTEFWIMWRRIAGGLSEQRHMEIWNYLRPTLNAALRRRLQTIPKVKGAQPEGSMKWCASLPPKASARGIERTCRLIVSRCRRRVCGPGPLADRCACRAGSVHKVSVPRSLE
jgi:hypothetical protein